MADANDEHQNQLAKQSKIFVEGETEMLKRRNAAREFEADRKRSRERGDDLAHAAQAEAMLPGMRTSVINRRREGDNAEDMVFELMTHSIAWRNGILGWAKTLGLSPDWERGDAIVADTLNDTKANTKFLDEVRSWARGTLDAQSPAAVEILRLTPSSGEELPMEIYNRDRSDARARHQEEDKKQMDAISGPLSVASYQGIFAYADQKKGNATDMIVELTAHAHAWRKGAPLLAKEWGVELDRELLDSLVHQALVRIYRNEGLMADLRLWIEARCARWKPAPVAIQKLVEPTPPKDPRP